jgi:hypothetical protein
MDISFPTYPFASLAGVGEIILSLITPFDFANSVTRAYIYNYLFGVGNLDQGTNYLYSQKKEKTDYS